MLFNHQTWFAHRRFITFDIFLKSIHRKVNILKHWWCFQINPYLHWLIICKYFYACLFYSSSLIQKCLSVIESPCLNKTKSSQEDWLIVSLLFAHSWERFGLARPKRSQELNEQFRWYRISCCLHVSKTKKQILKEMILDSNDLSKSNGKELKWSYLGKTS